MATYRRSDSEGPALPAPRTARFSRKLGVFLPLLILILSMQTVLAQGGPDVRSLLRRIDAGESRGVQSELPRLIEQYPGHPGLLYVKGLLTANGEESIITFHTIVSESPDSEWADDALFRLYSYSYAVGAYNTAARQAEDLRKKYPSSAYLKLLGDPPHVESKEQARVKDSSQSGFSVQVGAFSTSAAAQVRLRDMKAHGYSCELRTKMTSGSLGVAAKQLHAVWVGEFSSFEKAAAFAKKVKQRHNIDAIVVRR